MCVFHFFYSPVEHCLLLGKQKLWMFEIALNLFFIVHFIIRVSKLGTHDGGTGYVYTTHNKFPL